jgi:hypothetical protein
MLLHVDRNRPAPIGNHAKRDAISVAPTAKTTKKPESFCLPIEVCLLGREKWDVTRSPLGRISPDSFHSFHSMLDVATISRQPDGGWKALIDNARGPEILNRN